MELRKRQLLFNFIEKGNLFHHMYMITFLGDHYFRATELTPLSTASGSKQTESRRETA